MSTDVTRKKIEKCRKRPTVLVTSAIGTKKRKFLERTTLSFCLTIFCSIITTQVVGDKFFMRTRSEIHFNEAECGMEGM